MRNLRPYLVPLLMGGSGLVSATSDIVQRPWPAYCLVGLLLIVAATVASAGLSGVLRSSLLQIFPDLDRGAQRGALVGACLLLAAGVLGASAISQRLTGGVIAEAFPAVAELQQELGIVSRKIDQIADATKEIAGTTQKLSDDSDYLKAAAGRWISIDRMDVYGSDGRYNFDAIFSNQSAFIFDNVSILVRDADDPELDYVRETSQIMVPGHELLRRPEMSRKPRQFEVCVSGQRRSDGIWSKEVWRYSAPDTEENPVFRLIEASGPQISDENSRCL